MSNTLNNKWTPIKDRFTNEPVKLGDKVKNEKGQTGILCWDDYYNRYFIKSKAGGNLWSRTYQKIDSVTSNKIDTTSFNPIKRKR